jgi:hypothetical protein
LDFLKIKDLLKKKLPIPTACSEPVKIQEANNSIVSLKFYMAAHRRKDVSPYSTNLTEVEWDLVADLFERYPGQRATPAHYSRRELVSTWSTSYAQDYLGSYYPYATATCVGVIS